MMFPSSGTVPMHFGVVLKATIKSRLKPNLDDHTRHGCRKQPFGQNLYMGDLEIVARLGFGATKRQIIFENASNNQRD